MKYGIVIFPSTEIQDEANTLRKRYDPKYPYISPHITLKYTFDMDDTLREQVVEALKEIAKETKPFAIEINKISSFSPVSNAIYFKIENTDTLIELNEKMHTGVFPPERDHAFIPHITIAQDLPADEYSDIYSSLRMREIHFTDTIDRFQLCYQLDNGNWTIDETFHFGG